MVTLSRSGEKTPSDSNSRLRPISSLVYTPLETLLKLVVKNHTMSAGITGGASLLMMNVRVIPSSRSPMRSGDSVATTGVAVREVEEEVNRGRVYREREKVEGA